MAAGLEITRDLVPSPISSYTTVPVFSGDLKIKRYEIPYSDFGSSYIQNSEKFDETGVYWTKDSGNRITAVKLTDTEAVLLKIQASGISHFDDMVIDKYGNIWYSGYNTGSVTDPGNRTRYLEVRKIPYDKTTDTVGDSVLVFSVSDYEVGVYSFTTGTSTLGYDSATNRVVATLPVYGNTSDHSGYATYDANRWRRFNDVGIGAVVIDVDTNKVKPINIADSLNLSRLTYFTAYGVNSYKATYSAITYAENQGTVYVKMYQSFNTGTATYILVGFDLKTQRISYIKKLTAIDSRLDQITRVTYGKNSGILYFITGLYLIGFDNKWNKVVDQQLNSTSRNDITMDPVTEKIMVGFTAGARLLNTSGDLLGITVDDNTYHANSQYFSTPKTAYTTNILSRPIPMEDETHELTPTLSFEIRPTKEGVSQHFKLTIDGTVYDSSQDGWEVSEDMVTWEPFSGSGKLTGGVHKLDGVICDVNRPKLYVRVKLTTELSLGLIEKTIEAISS